MLAARRFGRDLVESARGAYRAARARHNERSRTADDRVRAYRQHRREAVVLNDKAKNIAAIATALAIGCWLVAGFPRFTFRDEVAFFGISALVGGGLWAAFHLLTQQVERGRWLATNAIVWNVLAPFSRDGSRRARKLRRDARVLRRMGLSTS
jgi:hypothetical protein